MNGFDNQPVNHELARIIRNLMGWSRFSHIDIFDRNRQAMEQANIDAIRKLLSPADDPPPGGRLSKE
jgi:hypothetical protein